VRSGTAVAVAVACTLAACGGGGRHRGTARRTQAPPRLTNAHPCPNAASYTCATLTVPLDHAGEAPGDLHLKVGYTSSRTAAHGVVMFLTGGPGQPGVPFIPKVSTRLKTALAGYRLVMFDQRGTGAGALRCPALQAAAGSSDLIPVPARAIVDCARRIGARRRYFTTPETLADIDALRRALGASQVALDGVSYGTFVAERYALAYPTHVSRLVLDSVVPQQGVDVFALASLRSTARVLRSVCAGQRCASDPARELATVVRRGDDGARILNALVADSIVNPSFSGIPEAIHQAAAGHRAALDRFVDGVDRGESAPDALLSQGLHEATLCLDLAAPWNPRDTQAQRAETVRRLAARLEPSGAFFPFDRATATGNGIATGCREWPATNPPDVPAGAPGTPLPRIPVLLFAGQHDLSTPLAWARQEAALAPNGRLVAVPGAGHSVQLRARDPAVRRILARFLAQRR
jgi:pimeloyl-ACP methyl ester carboxylesterase